MQSKKTPDVSGFARVAAQLCLGLAHPRARIRGLAVWKLRINLNGCPRVTETRCQAFLDPPILKLLNVLFHITDPVLANRGKLANSPFESGRDVQSRSLRFQSSNPFRAACGYVERMCIASRKQHRHQFS